MGLYTSPHVVRFRERIRVGGIPISEAAVAMWTARLRPLIEELGATFFEATTAMAFADFAARGAEIAVVEVGLGGRLDSTNVLRPLVGVVTKIEMDHVKYLGDTLELIAGEKAGIAKPGAPLIIGETRPDIVQVLCARGQQYVEALEPGAVLDVARCAGYRRVGGPAAPGGSAPAAKRCGGSSGIWPRCRSPGVRTRQRCGAGLPTHSSPGASTCRGHFLFDVAHNPDGVRTLVAALGSVSRPRPVHALVSILGDKDWPAMLETLDAAVDQGVLTVAPTAAGRGWSLDALSEWLGSRAGSLRGRWSIEPDFAAALRQAQHGAGTLLITGSFHTVGDAMALLGLEP